jgi:hypothetical protein
VVCDDQHDVLAMMIWIPFCLGIPPQNIGGTIYPEKITIRDAISQKWVE